MLNKFGHRMWVVFQARPDNRRNSCPYARCPWRLRAAGLPTLRRPSRAPAAGGVNRSSRRGVVVAALSNHATCMRKSPARLRAWCTSIPRAGQAPNPSPDTRTAGPLGAPQSSPSSHREWHEPPLYATSTRCEPKVPFFMAAPAARYFLLSSIGFGYVFELLTNGCEIPLEFKAARPDHCRPCTHRLSKPVLDASVQRASSRERETDWKKPFFERQKTLGSPRVQVARATPSCLTARCTRVAQAHSGRTRAPGSSCFACKIL